MKKLLLCLFLLTPHLILSQELDESFMKTLPESVRADLESKIEATSDSEKPVYRRASTMLDKPEMEKSGVFGESFFDTMQSSFMPINEPNFDASYILDFGDVLEIQLTGTKDTINQYSIKRDGSINIDDVGNVQLSGMPLFEAVNLIKSKVNLSYIGIDTYVSLVSIRDIQVLITGNAYNPGIYTLSGNSNILHALSMAGGVGKGGSYREIKLIRDNKVLSSIDLYDTFVFGKNDFSTRLKSGDTILVSPTKNIVGAISGVNRPGLYELHDNETYENLLKYANGLKSGIDLNFIQVQSLNGNKIDSKNLSFELLKSTIIQDNDSLIIREFQYGVVSISGAVLSPGNYKITEGETLSGIIQRAGGYSEYAYPFGGYLNNLKTQELNEDAKNRLYDSFLLNLVEKGSMGGVDNSSLPIILEQLREAKVTGRVIAEFDMDALKAYPDLDTLLYDGDEILIPSLTQQVYIFGEVSNQGGVRYKSNEDLEYYLKSAGGTLTSADINSIYIINPNGETSNLNESSKLSFFKPGEDNQLVFPGSIIYVPRTTNIQSRTLVASVWAPIISSLALSLASISALDN